MTASRGEPRPLWGLAGLAAGAAGLAVSYAAALALTIRVSPVVAVAELIIRITPGALAEAAISAVGTWDKPLLVGGILVFLAVMFWVAGVLARRSWTIAVGIFSVLALVGAVAALTRPGSAVWDLVPLVVGFVTWLVALNLLTEPLIRAARVQGRADSDPAHGKGEVPEHREARRTFLIRAGVIAAVAAVGGVAGRFLGSGQRHVEKMRALLRLEAVSQPRVPEKVKVGVEGVSPWQTPVDDFYLIHTAIAIPTIDPDEWQLRIHGLVDRELVLTYRDLVDREMTEKWITLNCVSNPVGGTLIGNAWWSGVRIADILTDLGIDPSADAVLQTSVDGWTCGTPLDALTDDRNAMLALAMNGQALQLEHGFPVRMVVPGLYGYVSATKWVVDLEVTRFADISAYWTDRGWSEQGPVKVASRIDVPRSGGKVTAGMVEVGGVAWRQHTGIEAVEIALDGGAWQPARLAAALSDDTWVQWAATIEVLEGDHVLRVRAKETGGDWQTGVQRDVVPDGSTGWHAVDFTATD